MQGSKGKCIFDVMIHYVKGNLLESKAEALVNTVNIVGVMGKGIALQFKEAFPENFLNITILPKGSITLGLELRFIALVLLPKE